jgi:transposase, IS6 family
MCWSRPAETPLQQDGSSPARCGSGRCRPRSSPTRRRSTPRVLDELVPAARHVTEQYANNMIESDHGRLKARLRPMRGLKRTASARTISAGHAFVQNLRRGHYAITAEVPIHDRVRVAFAELALCL